MWQSLNLYRAGVRCAISPGKANQSPHCSIPSRGPPTANKKKPKTLVLAFRTFPSLDLPILILYRFLSCIPHSQETYLCTQSPLLPALLAQPGVFQDCALGGAPTAPLYPSQGPSPKLSKGTRGLALGRQVIKVIFKVIYCCFFSLFS